MWIRNAINEIKWKFEKLKLNKNAFIAEIRVKYFLSNCKIYVYCEFITCILSAEMLKMGVPKCFIQISMITCNKTNITIYLTSNRVQCFLEISELSRNKRYWISIAFFKCYFLEKCSWIVLFKKMICHSESEICYLATQIFWKYNVFERIKNLF